MIIRICVRFHEYNTQSFPIFFFIPFVPFRRFATKHNFIDSPLNSMPTTTNGQRKLSLFFLMIGLMLCSTAATHKPNPEAVVVVVKTLSSSHSGGRRMRQPATMDEFSLHATSRRNGESTTNSRKEFLCSHHHQHEHEQSNHPDMT